MQSIYHYLRLMDRYGVRERESVEVTLDELADLLNCTIRNVKLIIKQLTSLGWLEWKPGLGRGNRSKMRLLVDLSAVVAAAVHGKKGDRGFLTALDVLGSLPDGSVIRAELAGLLASHLVPGPRRHSEGGRRSDSLLLPFYRELPNLDPLLAVRRTEMNMARQLFDPLVRWDGERRLFLPGLAIHWELEGDKWIFYLRRGVRFHDKKEFTSEDASFTLQRLIEKAPWARIRLTEAPDPYVFFVYTESPSHLLLSLLASPQASVVPNGLRENFAKFPIGTGPYKLVRNDSEAIVMEASGDYYREKAQLDTVEIRVIKELISRRSRGELSDEQPILYEHPFQIHREGSLIKQGTHRVEGGSTVLVLNACREGRLSSAGQRRQLTRAINPEKAVKELGGNRVSISKSFFPERTEALREKEAEERGRDEVLPCPCIVSGAWTKPLVLLAHPVLNHSLERTALWIRKECAAMGIPVEVKVVPDEKWSDYRELAEEADLLLFNAVTTDNREADLLRLLFDADVGLNYFLEPDVQRRLNRINKAIAEESDPDLRLLLLGTLEEELEASASLVHLYHLKQTAFYHDKLIGTNRYNPYGWIDFRELAVKPDLIKS